LLKAALACSLLIASTTALTQSDFPAVEAKGMQPGRRHPDSGSVFHVSTELVTVDVVASDKDGNVVRDLKPEDLRVFEDGKDRPIRNLSLEDAAQTTAHSQPVAKVAPAGLQSNFSGTKQSVREAGGVLLLIDQVNTPPGMQSVAITQSRKMLAEYDGSRPLAIYVMDGAVHVLQDFTTDQAALRRALDRIEVKQTGAQPAAEHSAGALINPPSIARAGAQEENVRQWDAELSNQITDTQVDRTLGGLAAIARRMQGFGGRKNLIWVSAGFPGDILADPYASYAAGVPRSYQTELVDLSRLLASAGVVIYPIDINGLSSFFSTRFKGDEGGRKNAAQETTTALINRDSAETDSRHQMMQSIADETGGRAYFNKNDLSVGIRNAFDDGRQYYVLAFTPRKTVADGSLHTIKLQCKRKGVHLQYRKGYYAVDATERDRFRAQAEQLEMEQALFVQRQVSTGIPLMGRVSQAHPDMIDLWIDGAPLSVLDLPNTDDKRQAQLEITVVSFDARDKPLKQTTAKFSAPLNTSAVQTLRQHGFSQSIKFARIPEATRVRIAVRDVPSGRIGTIDFPLGTMSASAPE
jgi:VWFA-related protein